MVKDDVYFKIRDDISVFIPHVFECLFVELKTKSKKKTIVGVIHRPNTAPKADIDVFSSTLYDIMDIINKENKYGTILGDMNINLLKFKSQQNMRIYGFHFLLWVYTYNI